MRFSYLTILFFLLLPACSTTPSVKKEIVPREILARNIVFDAQKGEISYTLDEDAYVRIRLGVINSGPMLAHLVDWEYRPKGDHKEVWDGKVGENPADYRGRKDLRIILIAKSSPDLHPAPTFEISFPGADKDDQGFPVLSAKAPVRVTVPEETMVWLSQSRFEMVFYFDDLFVYEEEEGLNPYTFHLDTTGFNNGLHTITFNILSSSGDAGTLTKVIRINNI